MIWNRNGIIWYSEDEVRKYRTTLQEIKAVAEDSTRTYDYLLGQEYTELVDKILDIITKAEEE